jgi:AmmeMemoRadiSam system protein B
MFYPKQADTLKNLVDGLLQQAETPTVDAPKALIAPHAGYIYSGPVAASTYRSLQPVRDHLSRVVVLAPAHRVGFRGVAATSADYLNTPLGDIPVDHQAVSSALELHQVQTFDQPFEGEHALEVQLPFLQRSLSDFSIAPFIVGQATATEVSELLELLWGSDKTLIVISSDLSHFLDYDSAKQRDARTTEKILALETNNIATEDACGHLPIQGLLFSARQHGLQVKALDVRNSGDTTGDMSRVVGYGAYVFN